MPESIYLIYKHTSPSGKSYIGQTKDYDTRCKQHQTTSGCKAFSAAIKKYGWDNFIHEMLVEHITEDEANTLEVFYINEHNTLYPLGYNLKTGGDAGRHTDITKARMSESAKNKPPISDETRAKLCIAQKGKGKGRKLSNETKAKLSIARRRRVISDITKAKISVAHKGRIISEDTRAKMSIANKGQGAGRKLSAESIAKRTETRRLNKAAKLV